MYWLTRSSSDAEARNAFMVLRRGTWNGRCDFPRMIGSKDIHVGIDWCLELQVGSNAVESGIWCICRFRPMLSQGQGLVTKPVNILVSWDSQVLDPGSTTWGSGGDIGGSAMRTRELQAVSHSKNRLRVVQWYCQILAPHPNSIRPGHRCLCPPGPIGRNTTPV